MRAKQVCTVTLTLFLAVMLVAPAWAELPTMKMTAFTPHQITTADKVDTPIGELEFFDGVPTKDTVDDGVRLRRSRPRRGSVYQHDSRGFHVSPSVRDSGIWVQRNTIRSSSGRS